LDPRGGAAARPVGDVLGRIGRVKYMLGNAREDAYFEEPWTPRFRRSGWVLWERSEVDPMALGYRDHLLFVGARPPPASISERRVTVDARAALSLLEAFEQRTLFVLGGDSLAENSREALDAARVVLTTGAPDDERSWELSVHYARKLVKLGSLQNAADRLSMAGPPAPAPVPLAYRRPSPEHIVLDLPERAEIRSVSVSVGFHPWWRATVEGQPARLLQTQLAFLGVEVPPGARRVELRFRPPLFVHFAGWVTAATLLGLMLAAGAYARRAVRGVERADDIQRDTFSG